MSEVQFVRIYELGVGLKIVKIAFLCPRILCVGR